MVNVILILILSFVASAAFGVVFEIHGRDNLLAAGIGGLLSRAVLLVASFLAGAGFIPVFIASFVASVYGEGLARKRHVPASFFIYPALIPLIPGDTFHYMIASLLSNNISLFRVQAGQCLLSLLALSLGAILSTTTMQSIRRRSFLLDDESEMGGQK